MKKASILAAVALAVLAWTGPMAFAQSSTPRTATVAVDFPFVVNGGEMPAGTYLVQIEKDQVIVRSQAGPGKGALAPILTRLGRHDQDAVPELVFDKVGGKFLLSEIWLAGEDGYLLLSTKEQHDHRVLGGSNPRK
jgi:hypothetical protein